MSRKLQALAVHDERSPTTQRYALTNTHRQLDQGALYTGRVREFNRCLLGPPRFREGDTTGSQLVRSAPQLFPSPQTVDLSCVFWWSYARFPARTPTAVNMHQFRLWLMPSIPIRPSSGHLDRHCIAARVRCPHGKTPSTSHSRTIMDTVAHPRPDMCHVKRLCWSFFDEWRGHKWCENRR